MSRLLPFLLAPLMLSGCGSSEKPFTDNSKDADLYAADVKQIAYDTVTMAKRSREPADQIQQLVTEIESQGANSRPVGSHKSVYDELLTAAKSLMDDCKRVNGKAANLGPRLDALKKIADKLPGTPQSVR